MRLQAESADAYTGLLSKDLPTEVDRLRLLEKVYDAGTIEVLEQVGIKPDWNCLEIGAGAGSIAYWLADRAPRAGSSRWTSIPGTSTPAAPPI